MVVRGRIGREAGSGRPEVRRAIDAPSWAEAVPILVASETNAAWFRGLRLPPPVMTGRVTGDTALAIPTKPVTPAKAAAATINATSRVVTGRPPVARRPSDGLRSPFATRPNTRVGAVALPARAGACRSRAQEAPRGSILVKGSVRLIGEGQLKELIGVAEEKVAPATAGAYRGAGASRALP